MTPADCFLQFGRKLDHTGQIHYIKANYQRKHTPQFHNFFLQIKYVTSSVVYFGHYILAKQQDSLIAVTMGTGLDFSLMSATLTVGDGPACFWFRSKT